MFVLNAHFCRELKFVAILRSKLKIFTQIKELTQILLRISEEKFGGWGSGGGSAPSTESGLKYF